MTELGLYLRDLREGKGLTQKAISSMIHEMLPDRAEGTITRYLKLYDWGHPDIERALDGYPVHYRVLSAYINVLKPDSSQLDKILELAREHNPDFNLNAKPGMIAADIPQDAKPRTAGQKLECLPEKYRIPIEKLISTLYRDHVLNH